VEKVYIIIKEREKEVTQMKGMIYTVKTYTRGGYGTSSTYYYKTKKKAEETKATKEAKEETKKA
jgi:hypothetical protein